MSHRAKVYQRRVRTHVVGRSKKTDPKMNGLCERTGKRRFATERDAVKGAAYIKRLHPHKALATVARRMYACAFCGDWHLTSQPGKEVIAEDNSPR